MPVTIGATETISKSFKNYPSNIPWKNDTKKPQKKPY